MRRLEEGTLRLLVAPLSARAFLLHKAHPTDAGFDLAIPTDHTLGAQEWARIDLEIVVQIPTGWYGQVLGRSSVFQRGLAVHPGVIDADYRGSIQLLLHNQTHTTQVLQRGDRLAQLLLLPVPQVSVSPVTLEALSPTARGAGGLGAQDYDTHPSVGQALHFTEVLIYGDLYPLPPMSPTLARNA